MKIGCVAGAWQGFPPVFRGFEEPIRKIADLGFEATEITVNREILNNYLTSTKIRELRELLDVSGLELTQIVSYPLCQEMNHPDEKERKSVIADFERVCDVAVDLGTNIVDVVPPFPASAVSSIPNRTREPKLSLHLPRDYSWEKDWAIYLDSMKKCMEIVEERRLRLAVEMLFYTLVSTPDSFLRLFDCVGSEMLGVNLDTNHLMAQNQYPTLAVYKLRERIFHTHIKDHDGISLLEGGNRPTGTGYIDYEELIYALRKVGYDYVLSIEVEFTDNPKRYIMQAKEHLEKILRGTW